MKFNIGDKVIHKNQQSVHGIIKAAMSSIWGQFYTVEWDANPPFTMSSMHNDEFEVDLDYVSNCKCWSCNVNGLMSHMQGHGFHMETYNDVGFSEARSVCECGTKNNKGQGHSQWCPLYNKEI